LGTQEQRIKVKRNQKPSRRKHIEKPARPVGLAVDGGAGGQQVKGMGAFDFLVGKFQNPNRIKKPQHGINRPILSWSTK
jgi:hypothetical protein